MILELNKLNEIFKLFGFSLKIVEGKTVFTDLVTDLPMKSFLDYYDLWSKDHFFTYTDDAYEIFYPKAYGDGETSLCLESGSSYFVLDISPKDKYSGWATNKKEIVYDRFKFFSIEKTKKVEDNLYEYLGLLYSPLYSFEFEEKSFIKGENKYDNKYLSSTSFSAPIRTRKYDNNIFIFHKGKRFNINFDNYEKEGNITITKFNYGSLYPMTFTEAVELIEQSTLFKNLLKLFTPTLFEHYSEIKNIPAKRIKRY